MSASRRSFLENTLRAGGLAGLLASGAGSRAFAEDLLAAAQTDGARSAVGPHNSQTFWDSFGVDASTTENATSSGMRTRGLFRKNPASSGSGGVADLSRQVDYFHYDPTAKTLRFATSIEPKELLDHDGDVSANINVNGFRMAGDDRQTFDKLQSAQLRIDVVQAKSILPSFLDPMAWMALAGIFPNQSGKLPPLENLSFDPSSTSRQMRQIVLPGGAAQVAVNLSMAHKDSAFLAILKTLSSQVDKFAPILGLPAISVTALKGFCGLYGALEQRTTFLLNSLPVRTFATRTSRELAQTQQGLNMVAGDYILVPHIFTAQLTPHLDDLELRQGYLVPKGSSTNTSVYDIATSLKPDITYISTTIGIKPYYPPAAT